MPDQNKHRSRREFLQKLTLFGTAGVITPAVLSACGGNGGGSETDTAAPGGREAASASDFSCTDTSGLTEQEIQMRENSEYVDESPVADKRCDNCQLYTEPAAGEQCGGCQVLKGPIHPDGYCNLWVAQQV